MLIGTVTAVLLALLLDHFLGEPKRWHPLVGFGNLAIKLEQILNVSSAGVIPTRLAGVLAWALLVLPLPLLILIFFPQLSVWSSGLVWGIGVFFLYFSIGWRSLLEHGQAVKNALQSEGIEGGRRQVAMIVSRDTDQMDEAAVSRATIESLLENGSDAIFAPLFWFVVAGPAGALLYRLANTLDAMWGYKTDRLIHFGWASARLDDLFNWLPARLTALTYALVGNASQALRCWREQAAACASPNGGPVMCSGAGAINTRLGGGAYYHGEWQARPEMGCGDRADAHSIGLAANLVNRTLALWCLLLVVAVFVNEVAL